MKSHSCRKTRGEGVPSTITLTPENPDPVRSAGLAPAADLNPAESQTPTAEDESAFCQHIDAQGRRCRMLVKSPDGALCAYHQRRLQDQRVSESAQELLACGTDFADAPAVNRFLGALVRQVTLKRIPRRDAVTLAYICQLLLNSLGAINREESLRLEEARVHALAAANRPPRIIWDLPHPPYEPSAEEVFERDKQR